jgi:hypothetical protein
MMYNKLKTDKGQSAQINTLSQVNDLPVVLLKKLLYFMHLLYLYTQIKISYAYQFNGLVPLCMQRL